MFPDNEVVYTVDPDAAQCDSDILRPVFLLVFVPLIFRSSPRPPPRLVLVHGQPVFEELAEQRKTEFTLLFPGITLVRLFSIFRR